jgi:hypothetical protein
LSQRFETAMEQMRENCKRDLPWFIAGNYADGHDLVVVAGGPSMKSRLGSIQDRQRKGARVMACNGARRFLLANGIAPDAVAMLDMSEEVLGFLGEPVDDALYLVASIVHPSVLDALENQKVLLWHCDYGEGRNKEQADILNDHPEKPGSLIGGGNTIGVRTLNLGFLMGFKTIHLYGLDSSYADDGADHAYAKHVGAEPEAVTVIYNDKSYRCSPWMAKQAGEFEFYYRQFTSVGVKVMVHGEGLIPDIWRSIRIRQRLAA